MPGGTRLLVYPCAVSSCHWWPSMVTYGKLTLVPNEERADVDL